MSVTFTWDDPAQTQLRFVFDAMWQREDFAQAIFLSKQLIEERGIVVDVIIDMSQCDSMPANLSDLRDHLRLLDRDRVGVLVFVTHNPYLQNALQLLNQLMRRYFTMYFTDSLHEANRIAQRVATTRDNRMFF